jgi:two-component system sensor histidine kinase FlrB
MTTAPVALAEFDPVPLPECSEEQLARAFALFTGAAASLERSYSFLQAEVSRLRGELQRKNHDLQSSLAENDLTRRRLRAILEGLPCGVVVVNPNGLITLANPEAQRVLSVSPQAVLPQALRARLDQVRFEGTELEWGTGTPKRWLTIRRAGLKEASGESSIFIVQDVTGLKKLQQEHETLQRRQALAEMSGVLAHEIRNPLGSLELFAGVLAESELEPEQKEWVGQLQSGIRMLAATVNNVLHFHSCHQPGLAPTDLGQLLRTLTGFLRPLAERARVEIRLYSGLDGIVVSADRERLQQVVLNLALNSFHFMRGGGTIEISGGTHAEVASAWIEVADSGSGIAPENLSRILEPGFTTRAGSPGLGLAVCKTIMEEHGGAIRVASRAGCGTTFTLELPLWKEPQ